MQIGIKKDNDYRSKQRALDRREDFPAEPKPFFDTGSPPTPKKFIRGPKRGYLRMPRKATWEHKG